MASLLTTTSTPSTSKDEKYRMSQLDLHNTSIANQVGTKTGDLDVEKAVDLLLKTRKTNKLLTKVIVCLIAYSLLITAAIFGVSIAAAEIAKDTTIDSDTGFVHAKNGNAIMKTSEAIEYAKPNSIHGLSDEDLAHLLTVQFRDGALMLHVKGFSRREERTMLLVEGGVLSFSDTGIFDIAGEHVKLLFETFNIEGEGRSLEETADDTVSGVTSTPIDQVPDGTKSLNVRINTLTDTNSDPKPKSGKAKAPTMAPTKATKVAPTKSPKASKAPKETKAGTMAPTKSPAKAPTKEPKQRMKEDPPKGTVEAPTDDPQEAAAAEWEAKARKHAMVEAEVVQSLVQEYGQEFVDDNEEVVEELVQAKMNEMADW